MKNHILDGQRSISSRVEYTSTAFEIPGKRIVKNIGVISGYSQQDLMSQGGLAAAIIKKLTDKSFIKNLKNDAFADLLRVAEEQGANAIIGIRMEISSLSGSGVMNNYSNIYCNMMGTAVYVEGESGMVSEMGQENSLQIEGPTAIMDDTEGAIAMIPVKFTNLFDPVCPCYVVLKKQTSEISLVFANNNQSSMQAALVDISLYSVFGKYTIENDYYFSFAPQREGIYQSKFNTKDLPDHIIEMASHADITVKEYVLNGSLCVAESNGLLSNNRIEELSAKKGKLVWEQEIIRGRSLAEELERFNNSKEMLDYVETQKDSIPKELYEKLVNTLQNRWSYERMYGSRKDITMREVMAVLEEDE